MTVRRWLIAAGAIGVALFGLWAPAALAQSSGGDVGASTDSFVVLTGRLEVKSGETFDDAIIFDGDATIDGNVTRTVMAFNGNVTVSGTVGQDVVATNGRVTLTDGATVEGNVTSSKAPLVASGATVNGDVRQQSFQFDAGNLAIVSRIAYWIAASVASFLLGLVLTLAWPRASDAIAAAARDRVGPSIGWGFLMFFGIPIVGGILLITLVGALLGIGMLLALVLIYTVGYTAGALAFGRLILKPPTGRFLAFLLGWGILRLVALVPVLGGLLFMAAAIWGLGAITVAAYRASRSTTPSALVPAPGAAPMPPMPSAP
jgi:cytoskeletal protein CcmA (bactofilin family)